MKLYAYILLAIIFQPALAIQTNHQFHATCQEITPDILERMVYTWNDSSLIPLEDLRYITVSYYDFDGAVHQGELVMHKLVADDVIYIFEKLFQAKFPIQSMRLIDDFEGSDDASMEANNASGFYARLVANSNPPRWSNHSTGLAVDINPLLNPLSKEEFFTPKKGERYLDRTLDEPGMITEESYIYKLFIERGWQWGGECFYERDKTIDRHHFQKIIPGINQNTN